MTNKQLKDYKNDIERELSLEVFSWMEIGGIPIRREDTLSYWFNGGTTNIGTLYKVSTREMVLELNELIKKELGDLSDTLVIDWNEKDKTLQFYLEFTRYKKVFDMINKGYKSV